MKFLFVLALVVAATQANLNAEDEWVQFKATNGKQYLNLAEERIRFAIFQDNLKKIEEHNKLYDQGLSTFQMGVTKFTDLTEEEFMEHMGLNHHIKSRGLGDQTYEVPEGKELAASIDWRQKGAVTPVKDQGQCGSCWAFSATGSMEGQSIIKKSQKVSLSEQNLVDCSSHYGNQGCNGGFMVGSFQYVIDNGITSEEKYPYTARKGTCQYNKADSVLSLSGFTQIPEKNENALASAVSEVGPISIGIDATSRLQNYRSGILDDPTCNDEELNHGVLAVGYGSENGQDFWIIKNSWGANWGEQGYFKYPRGKNACGVATDAAYPRI